jgi:hypothetical protein
LAGFLFQSDPLLVPKVEASGYEVRYREFKGGHIVPEELAAGAFDAFAS